MRLELPDNHNKECKLVDKRVEYDVTIIKATCSLCGGQVIAWPYHEKRCPECGARVTI